jgi:catechol 2,3-dioxygenase-like lactoylglutathione lyase family enzyme
MSSSGVLGLAEIVLWVHDMDQALHFYRDLLGLDVFSPPQLSIKYLRVAEGPAGVPMMIVLVPHPEPESEFPRAKGERVLHHMAFTVDADHFDELARRLTGAGRELRTGVHPVLENVRTVYVDDPEGNEVEIISPTA